MIFQALRDFGRRKRLHRQVADVVAGKARAVIVYQMGKVASSTTEATLQQARGWHIFRTHGMARWMNVPEPGQARRDLESWLVYHRLLKPKLPAKIVTLVRDPISRNLSAYFQNIDSLWSMPAAHTQLSMEQLVQGFFEKLKHQRPLEWFDVQFKPVLNLDVYAHRFDPTQGFQRITQDNLDVLILKTTLDDAAKGQQLGDLTGVKDLPFVQKNVGTEKSYSSVYDEFVRTIRLPEAYVNEMLGHRFTRHFFSAGEIEKLRAKWLRDSSAVS